MVVPVHDHHGSGSLTFNVTYFIGDWNFARKIARAHHDQQLALEFCGFVDDDGSDYDALVALLDQRPVAIVYTPTEHEMAVRIGGFQNSGVIHDGGLAKLSADAAADGAAPTTVKDTRDRRRHTPAADRMRASKERKARALERQAKGAATTAAGAPLPALVVRAIGRLGDPACELVQPVLHRDAPPRRDENGLSMPGASQLGPLVEHLKAGFGVHVLQTSHGLRNLDLTKKGADDKIEVNLKAGELGVSALMAIGRINLRVEHQDPSSCARTGMPCPFRSHRWLER